MKDRMPPNGVEEAVIANYASLVESMIKEAEPYSFQEYMGYACREALLAIEEGNYGIGAVYVLRKDGVEYVVRGRNGIISRKDTSLHAEFDAMDAVESLADGKLDYQDRIVLVRPAPHELEERIIVTTAEPCMMCAARMVTHGIDGVHIGAREEDGGAMLDGRGQIPAHIWREGIAGFRILTPNTSDPKSEGYIDPKFDGASEGILNINRAKLNRGITEGNGLIDMSNFRVNVETLQAVQTN